MTRQSTAPDAGADGEGPVRRRGQERSVLQPVDDPADRAEDRGPRRCGSDMSMRRLRREAHGPRSGDASTRHVPNKAAVLDGVARAEVCAHSYPWTVPTWTGPANCSTVARDFRQLALTHPNVVPLLGHSTVGHPARAAATRKCCAAARRTSSHCSHLPASPGRMPCTSTECCSATFTATSPMELQEVIERPEETDDVLQLGVFTGSRSPNSLNCARAGARPSLLRRRRRTGPLPRSVAAPRHYRSPHRPRRTDNLGHRLTMQAPLVLPD